MITIHSETESKTCTVRRDGTLMGTLLYRVRRGRRTLSPKAIVVMDDGGVKIEFDGADILDYCSQERDVIAVRRRWTISRPGRWSVYFSFLPAGAEYPNLIIPSTMYHENRHGEGKFPRGGIDAGWSFREDRMPVPSCAVLHDGARYAALFTDPAPSVEHVSSVRASRGRGKPALEIRIPGIERPRSYREIGILFGGQRTTAEKSFRVGRVEVPFTLERSFYIQVGACSGNVFRLFKGLSGFALGRLGSQRRMTCRNWSEVAALKLHHLLFLTFHDPRTGVCGIRQGRGNGWWLQHAHDNIAGSFLSKSLEGAYIFARVGAELGNDRLMDLAERMGRFFLTGALENGLHRDFYKFSEKLMSSYHMPFDKTTAEMRSGANARCNGESMVNYLRLCRLLKQHGREVPEFLDVARRNAEFYMTRQLDGEHDGSFGRWWSEDGRPISTGGTNGAHMIPVLVELERLIGPSAALDRALARASSYYGGLIDRGEFYGDTLDADCVDKEAGVILLRAFLDLYERSGDRRHLEFAIDAACYVLSWMWTYDVPFPPGSPLGKEGFLTRGMTAVSVAIQHIDFYGLFPAYDFLRLWEATGDDAWKDFAMAMIEPCSQLIATHSNTLNRSADYAGWQPEHIYQTDFDYFLAELGGRGTYDTCVAWVAVLTLGAMLDIRERFPGVLDFTLDANLIVKLNPELFGSDSGRRRDEHTAVRA